jgi:hypothetical protein
MERCGRLHTLSRERSPGPCWRGDRMGLGVCLNVLGSREICTSPGNLASNPRYSSPQPNHYTGWAILACDSSRRRCCTAFPFVFVNASNIIARGTFTHKISLRLRCFYRRILKVFHVIFLYFSLSNSSNKLIPSQKLRAYRLGTTS